MKQHVTVIPSDRLIIVDGASLRFAFDTPADLHALQWHEGRGEMEWTDDINHPLTPADYADDVAPFVALWETEKARLDAEANRPPTLEQAKAAKISEIRVAFAVASEHRRHRGSDRPGGLGRAHYLAARAATGYASRGGIETLAFPGMGMGTGRLLFTSAAKAMLEGINDGLFPKPFPKSLREAME